MKIKNMNMIPNTYCILVTTKVHTLFDEQCMRMNGAFIDILIDLAITRA